MSFEVGQRVETATTGKGTVAFVGNTQFSDGEWIGIILDEPKGKNNGTVQNVEYFTCEPNFGLFTRPAQLKHDGAMKKPGLRPPGSSSVAARKDSVMNRSGTSSKGSSPGISPAVSTERLPNKSGMGPRSMSKLADPGESRMSREWSNLSQSSVASTRSGIPTKPRQSMAPPPDRRQSLAPAKKPSVVQPPKPAPIQTQAEDSPLPPPIGMTDSGTELGTETVLSRAKKIDETAPSAPQTPVTTTPATSKIDNSAELEYLRQEVKDLNEKLENTRAKRKDDHAKLLEFERISIEVRTLQEVKNRLNDRVVELEKQLLDERKAAEDLKAWHENNKDSISEHQEMMEMATIEKELAEEKADGLYHENLELKEKIETMEAELEILKEEMGSSGGAAQAGNSVQMKAIETQNEKLKDALIKLRDLSQQATTDRQKAVEECERIRQENSELVRVAELLKRQAEIAESKIAGFQEQIDAAMGAEEMVTQLTNKNFDMEEKIAKLEEAIEFMEEARDLDEQLSEVQKQTEKDLLKEIEDFKMKQHELNGRIRDEQKHAFELSQTILKFRERMAGLNSSIQDQKDQILQMEEELHGHKNENLDKSSMVTQLQQSSMRNFSEAVERQINAIELEYSRKLAGYLKAFLPDNFAKIGGENDSIQMVVMFSRLSAKSRLFAKLSGDAYPQVPGGMRREHVTKSHKGEQWAHCARVNYLSYSLTAVLGQFESAVSQTTIEVLMKLTEMYGEMSTHERSVDQYLELLKTSRFDENTSLENFEKPIVYFQNVFSLHISGDGFNAAQWVSDICSSLSAGLFYCKFNLRRLTFFLQESIQAGELFNLIENLGNELAACENVVLKSLKHIPDSSKKCLKLESEFTEELLNSVAQLDRISSILRETCSTGAGQIGGITETEGFDELRVKEMIHGVIVKYNGWIAIENAFEPIRKTMGSLRDSLENVHTGLESARMEKPIPENKPFPPLLDRAHHRKQAATEAESLRWQMEKKDNEMLELRKQIKARIEDVSNFKLRLEMAESRLNSTNKEEGDKVKQLEEKIQQMVNDHKRGQIEFDETMDVLRREMKEVETENAELKQRANKISKETLWKNVQMETRTPLSSQNISDESASRSEVIYLETQLGKQMEARKRAELQQFNSKKVPGLISGPLSIFDAQNDEKEGLLRLIDKLHEESLRLRREENKHLAYVPKNPNCSVETMEREMEEFNEKREQFYDQLNSVNRRLGRAWLDAWGQKCPFEIPSEQLKPVGKMTEKQFSETCNKWGIVW
ncbi:unnamed protein product [Caenorhabditis angaria]|uniref:Dynactin subunit 1 n=1 Tax=Caenorhabditis angaria TaxID=860376 RepID=A0A9P1MWH6_9PELO|nr:unnamed protein product [Caenorhabditis angaria]